MHKYKMYKMRDEPGVTHILCDNEVPVDFKCDDIQKKINLLTKRKDEYVTSLGNMMCRNYPISLSFIPHPLCNWQIQRVNSLVNELAELALLQEKMKPE